MNESYADDECVDVFDIIYSNQKKKPGRKTKESLLVEERMSKNKKTVKLTKNSLKNINKKIEDDLFYHNEVLENAVEKMCRGTCIKFSDNSVLETKLDKIKENSEAISEQELILKQKTMYDKKKEMLGMAKDFVPIVPDVQICDAKTAKNSCNRKNECSRKIAYKPNTSESEIRNKNTVSPAEYFKFLGCRFAANDSEMVKIFTSPMNSGLEGRLFHIRDEYVDNIFCLKQIICKAGKIPMYVFVNTETKSVTTYTEASLKEVIEFELLKKERV